MISNLCFAHPRSPWINTHRRARTGKEAAERARPATSSALTCALPRRPKRWQRPVSGLAKRRRVPAQSSPSHALYGRSDCGSSVDPRENLRFRLPLRGQRRNCQALGPAHLLVVEPLIGAPSHLGRIGSADPRLGAIIREYASFPRGFIGRAGAACKAALNLHKKPHSYNQNRFSLHIASTAH